MIDPALEAISRESARTIESHLADFEAKMKAANRDPEHVRSTLSYVRKIANSAGFSTAGDITADGVNHYAEQLTERGRSARTVQAYLTAITGFTKWLTKHHKLPRDPLASVCKPNPGGDRRRKRRMLLPDEWTWLEATTMKGPKRFGVAGKERTLMYCMAIQTGLRSGELRSLTRGRLFLDANPPYITCKARSTKNKKDARQYIKPELADELRRHITTKSPKASVFSVASKDDVTEMFRADLAAARHAWLDSVRHDPDERLRREQSDFLCELNHEGEVLDFHGLRHTCGAWLAMSGADPKVVQTVMRHSSITLTMDTYGHLFPGQEADAVANFPDMLSVGPEALRATGTDDAVAANVPVKRQQSGRETSLGDAAGCDGGGDPPRNDTSPKLFPVTGLCDAVLFGAEAEGMGLE